MRQYLFATQVIASAAAATATASVTCGPGNSLPAYHFDLAAIGDLAAVAAVSYTVTAMIATNSSTQSFKVFCENTAPATIKEFDGPGVTAVSISAPANATGYAIIWW